MPQQSKQENYNFIDLFAGAAFQKASFRLGLNLLLMWR